MAKILIVEDDVVFGTMLRKWLEKKGYDVALCGNVAGANGAMMASRFDMVITDLRLPDSDGILLLQWIKEHYASVPVILMSNYADINSAVSAMKLGAEDYLEKPIRPEELNEKIIAALGSQKRLTPAKSTRPAEFVRGSDELSVKLHEHIELISPTNMSVLITGESGTGKEYVAKNIHTKSKRSDKPFIAVDCGAISRELGVSELFGHKKGAFTSAVSDKRGFFEEANGGTIFLDEIGNLSLEIQMQLLRALQERRIRAVGSTKEIAIDVRVVSATNENLLQAIADGRFREDLYHRINEFSLVVPALRERGADIMLFANNFLAQANDELEKSVKDFSADVERIFCSFHWSGNLRQMRNVIKRAVLFARGDTVKATDLPDEMTRSETISAPLRREDEREVILQALARCANNKSRAAKYLQIDRKTLYNKLKQYNIEQ